MKRFIANYDIYSTGDDKNRLAEVDLIFTLGSRLGVSEVKADRGFRDDQIDRLLNVASLVEADMVVFSTLKNSNSDEVEGLVNYLNNHDLKIPAFIITKEVLFEKKLIDLSRYFEVDRITQDFPCGAIIVAGNNP